MWCGYYTSIRITFKSTMAGGEKSYEKNSHLSELSRLLLLQAVVQQNSKIKFEPQWCKKLMLFKIAQKEEFQDISFTSLFY